MLICNFTQSALAVKDSEVETIISFMFDMDDGKIDTPNMLVVDWFRAFALNTGKLVQYQYEGVVFEHDANQRFETFWDQPWTDVMNRALGELI